MVFAGQLWVAAITFLGLAVEPPLHTRTGELPEAQQKATQQTLQAEGAEELTRPHPLDHAQVRLLQRIVWDVVHAGIGQQAYVERAAPLAAGTRPAPVGTESDDNRQRRLVVGTWHDDFQGKRTMVLKEDGTGTMIVELSGIKATLFASRLRFDMVWSLENGRLKKRTIGGEPKIRVNMILKSMGDRVDEPILKLTEDQLLLLDKDGRTRYDWRRQQPN